MRVWVPNDRTRAMANFELAAYPMLIVELGGSKYLRVRRDGQHQIYSNRITPSLVLFDEHGAAEEGG